MWFICKSGGRFSPGAPRQDSRLGWLIEHCLQVRNIVWRRWSLQLWNKNPAGVFSPSAAGSLPSFCFISLFFLLSSEGPKIFRLRLSDAIRSWKKLLWACLMAEALRGCFFLSHSPLCASVLFIFVWWRFLYRFLWYFLFFTLLEFAWWSSLAQSPELHQLKSQ